MRKDIYNNYYAMLRFANIRGYGTTCMHVLMNNSPNDNNFLFYSQTKMRANGQARLVASLDQ